MESAKYLTEGIKAVVKTLTKEIDVLIKIKETVLVSEAERKENLTREITCVAYRRKLERLLVPKEKLYIKNPITREKEYLYPKKEGK